MKNTVFLFLALITFQTNWLCAQGNSNQDPFSIEGTWMYADSGLTLQRLTRSNALLVVNWCPSDPNIEDVALVLEGLTDQYNWLSVVGITSGVRPYQREPRFLNILCQQIGWNFPLLISDEPGLDTLNHWSYSLYNVGGELLFTSSENIHAGSLEKPISELSQRIKNNMTSTSQSHEKKTKKGLEVLNLFLAASDLEIDPNYELLFISDTGHDRIVILDLDGQVQSVIGTGEKGNVDGEITEARFNRPSGIAYDVEKRILYVADRGNNSIRKVTLENSSVSTLSLLDIKGKPFELSSPPDELSFEKESLLISSPGSSSFLKVNLIDYKVSVVFGTENKGLEIQKNSLKTEILSASGHVKENNSDFFLDQARSVIYMSDKLKNNVLLTADSLLSEDTRSLFDKEAIHLISPVIHEGRLLLWNAGLHKLLEIDPYSYTLSELKLDSLSAKLGYVSGMRSLKGKLYILDGSTGIVYILDGKKLSPLIYSNKERVLHVPSDADLMLHLDDIRLNPQGQTVVNLHPVLPPHFALDPQTPSYVYPVGNDSAVVLEEGNLRQQELKLILFPDLASNQVNMMAELNFCEKSNPSHCYQRWVTINIPIIKSDTPSVDQELDLELFKGL